MHDFPYQRIVVVGTTSAGKSTLGRQLSERLGHPFIDLDALHWEPNWKAASEADFQARVDAATSARSWVVAGNYHAVRDQIWPRAELIVWLDYSFPVVFWRLLTRTIRRGVTGEELWNGNRENFWWHLKIWSDESLFHWLFKTYWRRKREYPLLLDLPQHAHLVPQRLRSPRETEAWLRGIRAPSQDLTLP